MFLPWSLLEGFLQSHAGQPRCLLHCELQRRKHSAQSLRHSAKNGRAQYARKATRAGDVYVFTLCCLTSSVSAASRARELLTASACWKKSTTRFQLDRWTCKVISESVVTCRWLTQRHNNYRSKATAASYSWRRVSTGGWPLTVTVAGSACACSCQSREGGRGKEVAEELVGFSVKLTRMLRCSNSLASPTLCQ